ncbi:hypothetical protein GCM10023192_71330 [Amycolatopsis samaneae]
MLKDAISALGVLKGAFSALDAPKASFGTFLSRRIMPCSFSAGQGWSVNATLRDSESLNVAFTDR